MESGSIANWILIEGAEFNAGDIFCSIETDKATVDFEAQDEGVLAKILVPAGSDDIKVGDPIMVIVDSADDVAAFADFKLATAAAAAVSTPLATKNPSSTPPVATAAAVSSLNHSTPTASAAKPFGGRIVASPLAHQLAREMGYNIGQITGSGPAGRVIADDVKEFIPSAAISIAAETSAPAQAVLQSPIEPPVTGAGYTDYPLSDHARNVAARLAQSKRNVPHYYLTVDISVDELLKTRARLNKSLGDDSKLGVYELLIKAAATAMKSVPSANASWMESVVRVYDSVDINIVVGSGDSLYTPVIADAAGKGLRAISLELNAAAAALHPAQEGDASSLLGSVGTFTVMNLGMYGIKSCAPIIREPQACALAIGALENRIVPNDDLESEEIYKESVVLTATLSCDHRVVDGAVGAQWLSAFKSHVENPDTLLL
jgi:pyruvate dehydrogenase E2 component (dihydrolipoamide acetyltransferase)